LSYRPTAEEFEKPTPQLLSWLENSLSYYQQQGNEKAIAVFQPLLEDAKQKANIITRSASWLSSTPTRRMNETGFAAMLNAARPARATIEKPQPETRGAYGFRAMLTAASSGGVMSRTIETRDLSTHRVPYGFSEMLESAFPNRPPVTLDDKPRARRGMGFRAMLEGASRGT